MTEITDDEWEKIEEFDTHSILYAVDKLDIARGYLSDREDYRPPEIRDSLMKLHRISMDVVHSGHAGAVRELFDIANDLEDQLYEITTSIEYVEKVIRSLLDVYPESISYEYD